MASEDRTVHQVVRKRLNWRVTVMTENFDERSLPVSIDTQTKEFITENDIKNKGGTDFAPLENLVEDSRRRRYYGNRKTDYKNDSQKYQQIVR